jgi:hypothetical protein
VPEDPIRFAQSYFEKELRNDGPKPGLSLGGRDDGRF